VRVLARVFVTELMADSGATESIIPVEGRRGKKLWFRVHRRSTRNRICGMKGEGRLVYWGLCLGYWNICFLPYVRGKLSLGECYRLLDRPENMRMALLEPFFFFSVINTCEDAR